MAHVLTGPLRPVTGKQLVGTVKLTPSAAKLEQKRHLYSIGVVPHLEKGQIGLRMSIGWMRSVKVQQVYRYLICLFLFGMLILFICSL